MKKQTRVTHPPAVRLPDGNEPVIAPIYQSVKFVFPDLRSSLSKEARLEGYYYTRGKNPTLRQLELLVAELQDRPDAVAVASGMAAVTVCLLGVLRHGDHMIACVESYKPGRMMIRELLGDFGIGSTLLSIHDLKGIEAAMARPETRLLFFESPTNPMLQVADIEAIVACARKHDVITVLDNTFAGFHNHGQFDIDYFVHSLTKYASGHGDVMAGAVIANSDALAPVRRCANYFGPVLDPGAAGMVVRGLKTYFLRYERQCENAGKLASFLAADSRIERVCYPGLPDDPGHQMASRQMADFGAIVSFDLSGDAQSLERFVDALQLFSMCASLGSTESLVAPVKIYYGGDLDQGELETAGISASSVRLAVGVEDADDLIADIDQALSSAFAG